MKKLSKISLLAVLMFVSIGVYAYDETFSLKVKSNTPKSIMFYVREAQDVEFSIYGSDQEMIYKQEIHAVKPAAKTYNLEAFPDGSYLIKLETKVGITAYQIQIEDGKTIVEKPLITEKFKPVFVMENGVITLNMENADKGPVVVKILDEYNDELYNTTFNDNAKLNKKFNITKTSAKEITFIISLKNQEYIETISLR